MITLDIDKINELANELRDKYSRFDIWSYINGRVEMPVGVVLCFDLPEDVSRLGMYFIKGLEGKDIRTYINVIDIENISILRRPIEVKGIVRNIEIASHKKSITYKWLCPYEDTMKRNTLYWDELGVQRDKEAAHLL